MMLFSGVEATRGRSSGVGVSVRYRIGRKSVSDEMKVRRCVAVLGRRKFRKVIVASRSACGNCQC